MNKVRCMALKNGDMISLSHVAVREEMNCRVSDLIVGGTYGRLVCVAKTGRRKWWKFWLPKYKSARFIYQEA